MALPAPGRLAGWDTTARRLAPTHTRPQPQADPAEVTLWGHVAALVAWLDTASPRTPHEITLRMLKLAEETGEAVSAYIGMTGANARKGTYATSADVTRELCDVVVTAVVALASIAGDTGHAQASLQTHLLTRSARLVARLSQAERDGPGPGEWACHGCGDAYFGSPPEHGLCPACAASPSAKQVAATGPPGQSPDMPARSRRTAAKHAHRDRSPATHEPHKRTAEGGASQHDPSPF